MSDLDHLDSPWQWVIIAFDWLWRFIGWFWSAVILGGIVVPVIVSYLTVGSSDQADLLHFTAVHALIAHPLLGLFVLALAVVLTRCAYLAHTLRANSTKLTQAGIPRRTFIAGFTGLGLIGSYALFQLARPVLGSIANALSQPDTSSAASPQPTPRYIYIYRGHHDQVNAIAWSPDSKRIASASLDKTVQVWDATTGKHALTYSGQGEGVWGVAWSPDGKQVASGGENEVQVWDASTGQTSFTYKTYVSDGRLVAWSPDGKWIASGGYAVTVWDAATGNTVYTYYGHTSGLLRALSWAPDSTRIASAGDDKTVQVWDATTGGNAFIYHGHAAEVWALGWSPNGKWIASGGGNVESDADRKADHTVQVWDAVSGKALLTYRGHNALVSSLSWSPDSKRIVSCAEDSTTQVWDASTGHRILTYYELFGSVAWSPNGKIIASADSGVSGSQNVANTEVWQAP